MNAEDKRLVEAVARRTADATVKKTLTALGIDATTPEAIIEFQQDVALLRNIRRVSGAMSTKAWVAAAGFLVATLGSVLTLIVQRGFGGH